MVDLEKIVGNVIKESEMFSTSDLLMESVRDLAKDEIKSYMRKKIEDDPKLQQEIKEAVSLYLDAKAKEALATMKLAKAGTKLGLNIVPKPLLEQFTKEFVAMFEDEITDIMKKSL